jgi:hypothetical protein
MRAEYRKRVESATYRDDIVCEIRLQPDPGDESGLQTDGRRHERMEGHVRGPTP